MSKTWYGHHIETIKGYDYVKYKDYLELDTKIDDLQQENKQLKSILTELEKWLISHLDDEYYWSKIYWYLENLKEKYGKESD